MESCGGAGQGSFGGLSSTSLPLYMECQCSDWLILCNIEVPNQAKNQSRSSFTATRTVVVAGMTHPLVISESSICGKLSIHSSGGITNEPYSSAERRESRS
jgi:hypothetical protein